MRILLVALALLGCKADAPEATPAASSPSSGASGNAAPSPGRPAPTLAPGSAAEPERLDGDDILAERRKARLGAIDTDGDGTISDTERAAARLARAGDIRARLDTNGDGKVTPDELASSRFRRFDPESADLDRNGDLSVDEIAKVLEQRSGAWGAERRRERRGPGADADAGSGSGSGSTP